MLRQAIALVLVFYSYQLASAEECSDLAAQIGRDYDKYGDSSQVESIKKANLCAAHYETATSEQRAQIEASYKLFSGNASGSSNQIRAMQDEKCESQFGSYWSSRVTSSELNRVSSVGADVVRDCLNQKSFRLTSLQTSGDAVTAVFRYGGLDQIILNGVVIAPSNVAQCSALYGGAVQSDLGKISNTKLKPNETLTLQCTRKYNTIPTNQKHYEGGIIGVSTNADSPMIPIVGYDAPIIATKAADELKAAVSTISTDLQKTDGKLSGLERSVRSANLECQDVYVANSQDATCPTGWLATGCAAGHNKGSHSIQGQVTCHTNEPVDWTLAHCCHVKVP